jgi:hypothetical protein
MTETTNDLQSLTDVTEIDDVEAHGLREVAAAATIGAAVVGAGGVALAAAHTPAPKTPAIVQQASDDTRDLVRDANSATNDLAGAVRADAASFTKHVAGSAHQIVDPRVQLASNEVHDVAGTATDIASDASQFAARTASSAAELATTVADDAKSTAIGTANNVKSTATNDVQGVTKTTLRIVTATRSAIDQGWDLSIQAFGANGGMGGSVLDPTGRVTVTNATGHVLGSVKLGNGACTLHIKGAGKNETLTINYGGNQDFSAAQLNWKPPVGF